MQFNPFTADHDENRFKSALLDDQITVAGHQKCINNLHLFEVEDRGSETQFQVAENINKDNLVENYHKNNNYLRYMFSDDY